MVRMTLRLHVVLAIAACWNAAATATTAEPRGMHTPTHGWWAYDAADGRPMPRPYAQSPDPEGNVLPLVLGPNVNGIELASKFSSGDQPLAVAGYLDVTKPPFNADPSGKTDATAAIQAAVIAARKVTHVCGSMH